MNDFIKSEWKWILSMAIGATLFFGSLRSTIQDTKDMKPQITDLQKKQAVQEEINQNVKELLIQINTKMDRMLRR